MTRAAGRARRRPPRAAGVRRDLRAEVVAASLQNACLGWVVIWSAWRQTFTAFSAIGADPLIIDEGSVSRLLERIAEAEIAVRMPRPAVDGATRRLADDAPFGAATAGRRPGSTARPSATR